MTRLLSAAALTLLLSACGSATTSDQASDSGQAPTSAPTPAAASTPAEPASSAGSSPTEAPAGAGGEDAPAGAGPSVVLSLAGGHVSLPAWSYCTAALCVDGSAPDVGALTTVDQDTVRFVAEAGWDYEATFRDPDDACTTITVPVRRTGETSFELAPVAEAGTWVVDLYGSGPGRTGGDLSASFVWDAPGGGSPVTPDTELPGCAG